MVTRQKAASAKTVSDTPLALSYIAKCDLSSLWDAVRALGPMFVGAYLAFHSMPRRKGPLPWNVKSLGLVAINVATTHLRAPGALRYMQNALRLEATAEEIFAHIQLPPEMCSPSPNMVVRCWSRSSPRPVFHPSRSPIKERVR